ncbi:MAG: DUF6518 family protein [Firmicutes bacterium]|nr:DUF6518 family protein [Bacillota bacterium]
MSIKEKFGIIREYPEKVNAKREALFVLLVILIGLILGFIAKATDSVSVMGEIGTYLGVWIFAATLIAAFSRSPLLSALHTLIFFLAMLISYYAYGSLALGFFPRAYFLGWLIIALLSPIGGFVVWFSRGKGRIAIICASIPIAMLIAEGHPAYYTYKIPLILDLIFALILIMILPKTWKQRGFVTLVAAALSLVLVKFYVLSFLPW